MPGDSEFFPPVQYLPWWGLIGVALLLLVAAWYSYLILSTRASRVPAPEPAPERYAPTPQEVRGHYLDLLDELEGTYRGGAIGSREAHQKLSLLVRSFVSQREGVRTVQLTLADLRSTALTPLANTVERLYPAAFGSENSRTVGRALEDARQLVSTWR